MFLWLMISIEQQKKNRGYINNRTKIRANQLKSAKAIDETGSKTDNSFLSNNLDNNSLNNISQYSNFNSNLDNN